MIRAASLLLAFLALFPEPAGKAAPVAPKAIVVVSPGPEAYRIAGEAARRAIADAGGSAELVVVDDSEAERDAAARLTAADTVAIGVGARAAKLVRKAAPTARLVYAMVLDPGSLGLPAPGDAPRDGLTGVTMDVDPAMQLDVLHTLAPAAKRIGILYDPALSGDAVRRISAKARTKGFEIVAQAVRGEGDVVPAAQVLLPSVDALWGIADPTVLTAANARALILLALRAHKPLLALSEGFVRTGALAALAADPDAVGRAAGSLALELARGGGPKAPIAPPSLDLYLNRATANYIGVAVPQELAARASAVFPTP